MALKQLSVFLENKPSQLLNLADILRKNDINMRALSLSETTDFGIARLVVDNPDKAAEVLKEAKYVASLTPVLAVELNDEAGGLYNILSLLASAEINLEYSYAFILKKKGAACSVIRVNDPDSAEKLFTEAGIPLIGTEDIA